MENEHQDLSRLLSPRSIAIVGASPKEGGFSRNLVNAMQTLGFEGDIFLVNPRYDAIAGAPCYPEIASLPTLPDSVLYAVGDQRLVPALEEAAAAGVKGGVIFGRAHGANADDISIQDAIKAIGRSASMSICGANCMGFINLLDRTQVTGMPFSALARPSGVSLVSHSGSTWSGLVGNRRQIGFDYAISAGQELVTNVSDYLDYILDQPTTRAVVCVLETLRDPTGFLEALSKADRRNVPVIVLKLGRSEIGQQFAISHSGAISGSAAVYDAILRKHNVIQVRTLDELLDTVELFARSPAPPKPTLALGTDSGGERQLIVDIAADIGLEFPALGSETLEHVQGLLDPGMEAANPLDYWGDGADVMAPALTAMGRDDRVGMVVMAANMPGGRNFLYQCIDAITQVKEAIEKPVALMGNISSTMDPDGIANVREAGIPVLMGTESGLKAIQHFLRYTQRKPYRLEDKPTPAEVSSAGQSVVTGDGAGPMSSTDGFKLLELHGIPCTPYAKVESLADIEEFAASNGYPVVLKIDDPDIPHKSDLGGVVVGLAGIDDANAAFRNLRERYPDAPVIVQKQVSGYELILGMTTDPDFGPVVTLGLGGIYAEVFKDVVLLPLPFDEAEVKEALRTLKSYPILAGARGRRPANIDMIAAAVVSFGRLCVQVTGAISEIEINPLIAGTVRVFAV
ncbi:acetate--CoA ligase family protein, partial [Mesorhizobium sp. PUT5]|uniref:acetate--CoA ligase family protein n=1 Tax=Mesorhizobium sp. PUT5 TaxID=3454629 RepID=UPI003FA49553